MTDLKIIEAEGRVSDRDADLPKRAAQPFWLRQGAPCKVRFNTFLLRSSIGRPFKTLLDCGAPMYGGVPEKFPNLRVALLACG